MYDEIIRTEKGSVLQHGKFNDRIYLMGLGEDNLADILDYMNNLARDNKYGKIFAKAPLWAVPGFKSDGYITEAYIPGYIKGRDEIQFVSKFLNSDRLLGIETDMLNRLSELLKNTSDEPFAYDKSKVTVDLLGKNETNELAGLYRKVFKTYPFPIHDPEYLKKAMDNTRFFGVRDEMGDLVAAASSEIDKINMNAEMTDFAVLNSQRGKKLSLIMLNAMEMQMKEEGIKTLYTIARLNSLPMNKTFLRMGYKYTGTLIKNTNISGKIESMNVLYKQL